MAQPMLFGKADAIVTDFFGVSGTVGNLADFFKVPEDWFRFQIR